jgi:NAD+ synthase (glutamine-hydrolysing)
MRLALCQMNATVGEIAGNAARIREGIEAARAAHAQLVVFPELAITGYPPEDLLLRQHFLADARAALEQLAAFTDGIVAVVGFPHRAQDDVYNAAAVLAGGRVHAVYHKVYLPNYGVFDEQRYFQAGREGAVIDIGKDRVGLTVCEDIWEPGPPAFEEAIAGASLIVNISASPYHAGKGAEREAMFAQRAREHLAYVAFCGLVGGQDELVFDGYSCVLDHTGATLARGRQFEEDMLVCDLDLKAAAAARLRDASHRPVARRGEQRVSVLEPLSAAQASPAAGASADLASGAGASLASVVGPADPETATASTAVRSDEGEPQSPEGLSGPPIHEPIASLQQEVYAALMLGLRDYVEKNGFGHVVLGLSGGIDSALVACLAADALGGERVSVAIMPSQFSSEGTQADAHALAKALGASIHELPIEPVIEGYLSVMSDELGDREPGVTQENLQARIRGNLLMALSNEFGWLVLTTGNKSEMSVGYTTLYGDLAGGFAVIKDVPKTLVYELCEWRNSPEGAAAGGVPAPIPATIMSRAPSAELRLHQRDEDSLPPYPLLDRILQGYVELDLSREQLISQGLPAETVDRTIRLVDLAEYKRRQAPPGIKISTRAFGRDRRMPITNRYRG